MKRVALIKIVLFLLLSPSSFAQLDRANKFYDDKEYTKAIKLYENALKKGENTEALEKIANSYRILKDYTQAELYYEKLMLQNNIEPLNHLYYGLVLKGNNKFDEAKEEFKLYAAASNDKKTELLIKSCDDIKTLAKKIKQVDVNPVSDINTEASEFSPVFFKDQLVFVSDRIQNMSSEKYNYLHVYFTKIKKGTGENKKAEPFPYPVNTEFHDGPVSFNAEQNMMLITHVDLIGKRDKNFVNRSKLYVSNLKEKKWSKPIPFQYNSDDFSIAHACISADGKQLFFASDMPGGQGGMDIYVCEKDGENWGTPKNMGNTVNTAGEEVFPYIRKDGTLFFSSDGHSGFGGLDVFSAIKNNDNYSNIKNIGAILNSYSDDFGISFSDDNTSGYFSSDRPGGKGLDDIYSFTLLNNEITIAGKIVIGQNTNMPFKKQDVSLLSEDGKIWDVTTSDEMGFFKFENLESTKKYLVKLDNATDSKIKYYLLDDKEKFIRQTGSDGTGGKFVFRNLPANPNEATQITNDGVTLAGNLLVGKGTTKPLSNTKINLVDENGKIVQTVITNEFGSFVFTNLPPDNNYLVKVEENDVSLPANTRIILTNKSGKELQSTNTSAKGSFTFTFLASDKNMLKLMEVPNVDLRIDFKGKFVGDNKKPIANTTINLVNEKGEIIQSAKTDKFGAFHFENLPADQNVLFTVDETDPQLKNLKKIVLTDNKDNVVKEIKIDEGVFRFSILPSEKTKLGVVYVDDPWLKVMKLKNNGSEAKTNLTIVEKVYYNYGKYEILPEAAKILDKVINLMERDSVLVIEISSHTDSRSSKEYNMKLSQQRAMAAVDYIVKNGITKDRISGKGYGESKLINKCADAVECSEEEHAKNRRTEFQIARKAK